MLPLLKVNCAAMADSLLESELFGHEPGAFTGATRSHQGRFERADGGTLFLDELGTMSVRLQEKLLRLVEYGEFERLGGQQTLQVDVRVIAATNIDLRAMAARGSSGRTCWTGSVSMWCTCLPCASAGGHPDLAQHFAVQMCRAGLGHVRGLLPCRADSAVTAPLAGKHSRAEERGGALAVSLE